MIGAKPGSQGEHDEDLISQADRIRRRIYGDRAIEVLREAVRGGFLNAEILRSGPDLAAIRGREDFRKIVAKVEEPAEEQE